MKKDCYYLDIIYDLARNKFTSSGDLNDKGRREVVETFLRGQIEAGEDRNKPIHKKVYRIRLGWHLSDDEIEVASDTGNRSLRDGLLLAYLRTLEDD